MIIISSILFTGCLEYETNKITTSQCYSDTLYIQDLENYDCSKIKYIFEQDGSFKIKEHGITKCVTIWENGSSEWVNQTWSSMRETTKEELSEYIINKC